MKNVNMEKIMNATELRKTFLEVHAGRVLQLYRDRLDGEFPTDCDISALDKMWDLLQKVIVAADDKSTTEASTTAEVIAALSKGKITAQEAKELMYILKLQADVDGGGGDPLDSLHAVEFLVRKKGQDE